MNSYNNKNHNNNIKNDNSNNYFYNKAASIYSGFDLIISSLVGPINGVDFREINSQKDPQQAPAKSN